MSGAFPSEMTLTNASVYPASRAATAPAPGPSSVVVTLDSDSLVTELTRSDVSELITYLCALRDALPPYVPPTAVLAENDDDRWRRMEPGGDTWERQDGVTCTTSELPAEQVTFYAKAT